MMVWDAMMAERRVVVICVMMVLCAGCAEPSSYEGFVDPLDSDAEAAKDLQR
jgi:hypothetical protein